MKRRLIFGVFAGLLVFAGCKAKEVQSYWIDHDIQIDGDASDWQNVPIQNYDEPLMSVGIGNDADNLYLLVGLYDQSFEQLFQMNGVTLWLDSKAGKDKSFGIRYIESERQRPRTDERPAGRVPPQRRLPEQQPLNRIQGLSIVDKEGASMLPAGERVPVGAVKSTIRGPIVEFRIPFNRDSGSPHAIDMPPEGFVGIGLEIGPTDEMLRRIAQQRGGRGISGGDITSARGGEAGGGAGRPGGTMDRTEIWLKISLVSDAR
ncbi:hypothetical protein ACFL5L_06635 [candidate division KSB1 bacterium]